MVKTWKTVVTVLSFIGIFNPSNQYQPRPELQMTLEERVRYYGYPVEVHEVITEDGYILSLYHIPHGMKKLENPNKNRSVILLAHGMGGSPLNFIALGRESSPFYFADKGMDVWISCARGLEGSLKKKHVKWDMSDFEYWYYSLHEVGIYDLPAFIDYILKWTKQPNLFFVGHSAGGNEFWVTISEKPEYNNKVKMAITWASGPILGFTDYSILLLLSSLRDVLKGIIGLASGNSGHFIPLYLFKPVVVEMTKHSYWRRILVRVSWAVGSSRSYIQDDDLIDLIIDSAAPVVSCEQIFHFIDNVNAGKFLKYNHGEKKNIKLYGQKYPPEYNLSAAVLPSVLFQAPKDSIVTKKDLLYSIAHMPNASIYEVTYDKFTHLDYIFARNASELVYEPTYNFFKDFDEGKVPPRLVISKNNFDKNFA